MESQLVEIENLLQYDLSNRQIEDIDDDEFIIENGKKLEKLSLANNNFTEFTKSFLNLSGLIFLDLSNNKLTKISNIKNCVLLEVLILSNNEIKTISGELGFLRNLQHLDLSFNKLYIADSTIKSLAANMDLISLCLCGNLNFQFNEIKYKCLEWLKKLEFLENTQIFFKKENNAKRVNIQVSTKSGDKKQIRTIKEYIKLKMNDYENNSDLYKTENNYSKQIDKTLKSSYYYNSLKF
jgi:Leucine-rich repeat (LRR) protein